MALKKDALRATVADDSRDIAKGTAESKGRMKAYQFKFPPGLIEQFRVYCESQGMSLSTGVRQAVVQYMEKVGLR